MAETRIPRIERLLRPLQAFTDNQAFSGYVLFACAALATIWANSPWAQNYFHLLESSVHLSVAGWSFEKTLHHAINDGLMAVFFLLVGLEIKREVVMGELSSARQAIVPCFAALGGMVVTAGIYAIINMGQPTIRGWGIPMATDIAFALGILTLLGDRVPTSLKIFLTAFAIVDDIGAVVVIALFYTSSISLPDLAIAGGVLGAMFVANRLEIRNLTIYWILFALLWYFLLKSGVHATLAGVLTAFAIPHTARINARLFVSETKEYLGEMEENGCTDDVVLSESQDYAVRSIENLAERVSPPLQRLEHQLHSVVAFAIMPVFALANAGVALTPELFEGAFTNRITLGVIFGFLLGKPLGVGLFTLLAVKAGWGELPQGASWRQIWGVGFLGGVGFTMALFIANLAFKTQAELDMAKVAILVASLICGVIGAILLARPNKVPVPAVN